MKSIFRIPALALAGALLAGCGAADVTGITGGGGGGGGGGDTGSFAFQYSGSMTGAFNATPEGAATGSYATGQRTTANGTPVLSLASFQAVNGTLGNALTLLIRDPGAPGTVTFDAATCPATEPCSGLIVFNQSVGSPTTGAVQFGITHAVIDITTLTASRAAGTFTATATSPDGTQTLQITGGTFDVPVHVATP